MDAARSLFRVLRANGAFRGLPLGPPADRAAIEAADLGRTGAQRRVAASGQRGSTAFHARHQSLLGSTQHGVPPGADDAADTFSVAREGEAPHRLGKG